MMKNKEMVILLCAIVIAIALCSMSFLTLKRLDSLKVSSGDEIKLLSAHFLNQLYYSISDESTIIDNDLFIQYKLNNNLIDTPVLVICYSNFSCASCMDYLLDKVKVTFPEYENDKRIVFVAEDFKAKPSTRFGNTIVLRNGDDLGLESEESNEPFLFIESSGFTFHVFTPNSKFDPFFETYLSLIKDKYFTKMSVYSE